jgi:hypothetical protein
MVFNFINFAVVSENDPIETVLFTALQQLITIGGKRALRGILIVLARNECAGVPEIKDVTAHLLSHMDFPVMSREPTATELLMRVIEYIEKHKPDYATDTTTDESPK